MTQLLFLLTLLFSFHAGQAQAATTPLFSKGAETFVIKDKSGKTPTFDILNDSESERAIAALAVAVLNANPKVQPKLPTGGGMKLRVDSLELAPSTDGPNALVLSLKLSGYDVELDRPVDKAVFLSGKPIAIDFPPSSRNLMLFNVNSSGRLKMHLDKATNNIVIDEALANAKIKSADGSEGTEKVQFTGKGIRQVR